MLKFAFLTLGCKLNFSESSTISNSLLEAGMQKVSLSQSPDIIIINTCTVTQVADSKSRQAIQKAIRTNPNAYIVVTGCYSQLEAERVQAIEGVDLILGNSEKFRLQEMLDSIEKKKKAVVVKNDILNETDFYSATSFGDRTRTFLKIQDGCDYFCSYCTVPFARGRSRSDTIENVLKRVEQLSDKGVKEVILTGVNLGDFGKANNESLYKLLVEVEKRFTAMRFRLSSVEPNLLSDEIIELVAQSKTIMPHFHLPLQSASDKVLCDMGRKYDLQLFISRVKEIKKRMPHACIAADVIVGFPTESDEDFEKASEIISSLPISYLHVFTYSDRKRAKANSFKQKVPDVVKRTRSQQLHSISSMLMKKFIKENIGQMREVLWEASNKDGWMMGFTDNYIRVKQLFDAAMVNQTSFVKLRSDNVCFELTGI